MTTISNIQAVEIAATVIEARGFELSGASNQSEALYFRLPGYSDDLRVAAHACRHPYGIAYSLEFTYEHGWQRDEQDIRLDREQIEALAADAIEAYLERADEEEDWDEEED